MATLDPERVSELFTDCLFRDGEPHESYVKAEGIMTIVGFHPGRLASHRAEITDLLLELPLHFRASMGGGWSFLQACVDRHGNQWTGMHQTMEQLFQLGTAIGRVVCLLPRDAWPSLPGGVPYYCVLDEAKDEPATH